MECSLHTFWSGSSDGNRLAHDALDLLLCGLREVNVASLGGLFELFRSACANNGHIDARLGQHPRNRQLRHAHALLLRQALQVIHDRQVALKALALEEGVLAAPVIGGKARLWGEPPGEQPMRQRAVDEDADAILAGIGQDLLLNIAPEKTLGGL